MATRKKRITFEGLKRERAPTKGRREIWDTLCPGFGVRITAEGVKTFQVFYRYASNLRRKGLGRFNSENTSSVSEARRRAHEIIEDARRGKDPEIKEMLERQKQALAEATTFASVRQRFIEEYAKPRTRTWQATKRYLEKDLAAWDARPISTITDAEIIAAIGAKARKAGPYAGNRLFAHTRKLFRWAASQRLIASSPVVDMSKPGEEEPRDRTFTVAEIVALWGAWGNLGWPFGPMFRLLLVLGQRRDEIAGGRWPEIRSIAATADAVDPARVAGSYTPIDWIWEIPGERTKNGRAHIVPLPQLAIEIIADLPRFKSDNLFPAQGREEGHASGYGKAKARAIKLSGVDGWRLHDCRRTVTTMLGELGHSLAAPRVLNHTDASVTGKHYDRHDYLDVKARALDVWSRRLETIVRPSHGGNVVELRARQ